MPLYSLPRLSVDQHKPKNLSAAHTLSDDDDAFCNVLPRASAFAVQPVEQIIRPDFAQFAREGPRRRAAPAAPVSGRCTNRCNAVFARCTKEAGRNVQEGELHHGPANEVSYSHSDAHRFDRARMICLKCVRPCLTIVNCDRIPFRNAQYLCDIDLACTHACGTYVPA